MKMLRRCLMVFFVLVLASPCAFATNGDNLISIGPISRSMGGVGIAAPQDAISAVFANPAAMCFGPYCPSSEINFEGTLFIPSPSAKVTRAGQVTKADSKDKVYAVPAFGLSVPITAKRPFWRFGLAAFGVTGLGVDYKDTAIGRGVIETPMGNFPLVAGEFTELQIFKFSPALAFQPFEKWSFGVGLQVDYSTLDLRQGSSQNYGVGVQVGAIYNINDHFSVGLSYVSPQNITYEDVVDFDQDGSLDSLKLESPQQVGIGLAYTGLEHKLLVEADVKWVNWSGANGYEDFDWSDQWVFAIGAQYRPRPNIALRIGYNYGENPVDEHNNFNGAELVSVQGKSMPRYYYETFRVIGFPAIVEHHITAGLAWDISPRFSMQLGYVHAFENTIKEDGTDFLGVPVSLESSLYEDSIDMGFTWRF